jgi:hypothetical protein
MNAIVFSQDNQNIIILPFEAIRTYQAIPAFLSTADYMQINDLLIKKANEYNNKNIYPYIKINLQKYYRQYNVYNFNNKLYVDVYLFENYPLGFEIKKKAFSEKEGDYFYIRLGLSENKCYDFSFNPGSNINNQKSIARINDFYYLKNTNDEYNIYNIILKSQNTEKNDRIFINRSLDLELRSGKSDPNTLAREAAIYLSSKNPTLSAALLDDFVDKNSSHYIFDSTTEFADDINWNFFDNKLWNKDFSVITFSRIGIDTNTAIVYCSEDYSNMGFTAYYILEKDNHGQWNITKELTESLWIE